MSKLFLLFIALPLLDLYLLIQVGSRLGFAPTVALLLGIGLIGAAIARNETARVMREWRGVMSQGRVPEEGLIGAALVLLGGVMLVLPGFLTDVLALLLLVPVTRRWVGREVRRRFERARANGSLRVTRIHVDGSRGAREVEGVAWRSGQPPSAPAPSGERKPPSRLGAGEETDADVVDEPSRP